MATLRKNMNNIITNKIATKKHQTTSIGSSVNTNPSNKHKRKNYKKYRGQGR